MFPCSIQILVMSFLFYIIIVKDLLIMFIFSKNQLLVLCFSILFSVLLFIHLCCFVYYFLLYYLWFGFLFLAHWDVKLWSVDRGREYSSLVYRWFYVICRYWLKTHSCSTYFLDIFKGQWWREIFPVGRISSSAPSRRKGQLWDYNLIHEFWPVVWLDYQGLGKNMFGKLATRKFVEEVCR